MLKVMISRCYQRSIPYLRKGNSGQDDKKEEEGKSVVSNFMIKMSLNVFALSQVPR